jgi:hypothetical protein
MKAIAIIALIFGALSIIIPVGGIFIAMLCSFMAMVSFRSQPTISGVTFGITILSTAFLSPMLLVSEANASEPGEIYWFYVGFHLVLFGIALFWRLIRGPVRQSNVST